LPELPFPKLHPHPFRRDDSATATWHAGETPYTELCVTSNYTFLTGASHPEEFMARAAELGYRGIAITDRHTLAGVVRAHVAAKEAGIPFILGTCLRLTDLPGCALFVYPTDLAAYGRLCRLLTLGKRRAAKGQCHLASQDLKMHADGLLGIVLTEKPMPESEFRFFHEVFDDDRLSLAVRFHYAGDDAEQLERTVKLSKAFGTPLVATNDVHYHHHDRKMLHDIVGCIRHGCTLGEAGFRLHANAERYLKAPEEMHRLFADVPGALTRTAEIAGRLRGFSLDQLRYQYPDEVVPEGKTAQQHLVELAWSGAERIYPEGISDKVRDHLDHELRLIEELDYAPYFLTVHDLVRFARTGEERPGERPATSWQPVLCQGRGAAANSAVCFCLGVTAVDPTKIDLLFERFVSRERNEPPDIDIDFEHERREEVIQYIYRKYGRERAALTAEVITYRRRSAVRDVGKVLGLSLDLVDRLAKDVEWFDRGLMEPKRLRELGLNPEDPTLRWLARLVGELLGFPRHLSQHVGGFVITRAPLCDLVPIENAAMPERTVIEWDKDDIDAVGMLKVDVLGLGMLTALRKCLDLVNARHGMALTLATVPTEDPETYEMIQRADTVGVFQIESRAQMSMLPRLKPEKFYDLVIEVAIVRPGPIQGDMVHPYLRRRSGEEQPDYVHPAVKEVLEKTLGVPLFQEQCMALAVKAAGFTPGEADQLRRAMTAWKRKENLIYRFGRKLIDGMEAKGIPRAFAERCFEQIKGFSEYGFPESHAASFAILVYVSAWLKCHYPAEFAASLLNSQPMGFYAPAQLVRDVKEHGVEVLPVDVHHSGWDCSIEPGGGVRLGMRLVNGVGQPDADRLRETVARRGQFAALLPLWRASGVAVRTLRRLAAGDAFGSMGLNRQQALWQTRLLRDGPLPLFDDLVAPPRPVDHRDSSDGHDCLPLMSPRQHVTLDYDATGLSLKAHPVSFIRDQLRELKAVPCGDLHDAIKTPEGALVSVAGLVLVRQRPGTAHEVTFITLEDESGIANLIIWSRVYQRYRREAGRRLILAAGRVQRQGIVVHLVVTKLRSVRAEFETLSARSRDFH